MENFQFFFLSIGIHETYPSMYDLSAKKWFKDLTVSTLLKSENDMIELICDERKK